MIWKAHWIVRGAELQPADLWERISEYNDTAAFLIHLELTSHSVTRASRLSMDVDSIADAIGEVFELDPRNGRLPRLTRRNSDGRDRPLASQR